MSAVREIVDEHELYPVHEEDTVLERPQHERQVRYLRDALTARFPERCVTGEVCMYWVEMAFGLYRAPDVLVVDRLPPAEPPPVYLGWKDGPALLVIEVGSKSTFKEDEGPKVDRYLLDLDVPEYLYFWPHPNPRRRRTRMWRLVDDQVADVAPLPCGRFYSETVGLEFGVDAEGMLRIYERGGNALPDSVELKRMYEAERRRADALQEELDRLKAQIQQLPAKSRRRGPGTGPGTTDVD